MTEPKPAFSVVINGKAVNFERIIHLAKPFKEWVTGELRVLDRLGFAIYGRDLTRDSLTYDDLFGLVAYFAMKASPTLRISDLDAMTVEEFGKIAATFSERFMPIIFPPAASGEEPKESPLAATSETQPITSVEPVSTGHNET